MERTDQWHLCECGLPFPRGLPIVAGLLVCPANMPYLGVEISWYFIFKALKTEMDLGACVLRLKYRK